MSSIQSGVSNTYSQASEATSYTPPDNMVQVQMDNQEMVKHTNKEMSSTLLLGPTQDYGSYGSAINI